MRIFLPGSSVSQEKYSKCMKKRKCTHKNIALHAWLALGIVIEERLNNDVVDSVGHEHAIRMTLHEIAEDCRQVEHEIPRTAH